MAGLQTLQQMKAKAPSADGMSDAQFAIATHQHYYSDIPMADYLVKMGLDRGDVLFELRAPGDPYGDYLRQALATPGAGESQRQAEVRQAGQMQQAPAQQATLPSISDAVDRALRQGAYAPPQSADTSQNPHASVLPGWLGQASNTIRAATEGGMQTSTLNLGDEAFAGLATGIQAMNGQQPDYGRNLGQLEQQSAQVAALNPGAYSTGQMLGTAALMGKPAWGTGAPLSIGKSALTGGAYGSAFGAGEPGSFTDRLWSAARGGVLGAALGATVAKGAKVISGNQTHAAPTVDDLFSQARSAFKAAEGTGAVVRQPVVANYAQQLKAALQKRGVITPSGRVANYPDVAHALSLIDDFAAGDMTLAQAQTVREALARAAGSVNKSERAIGRKMLQQFDSFMEGLSPQAFAAGNGQAAAQFWKEGRGLYHTASKAKTIEDLTRRAIRKSKKSVAVGVDDSLRTRFDTFQDKESNLRGFLPAERAQIARVAEGTGLGNAFRAVGGLAPSSPRGLLMKGGLSSGIGFAIGGPTGAAVLPTATMSVGYVGKFVANLSSKHQAELASLIIRNGGALPTRIPPNLPGPVKKALGNLIVAGGALAPEAGAQILKMLGVPSQAPSTLAPAGSP